MKKVIFLLLLLLIGIAIIPLFLPKTIHEESEYVYDYDISIVYNAFVNTKKMSEWYQWSDKKKENYEYSRPSDGVNASFIWKDENGETMGRIKITQAQVNEFVFYEFQMIDTPSHTGEVIFQKLSNGKTRVVFTFDSAEEKYPYQIYYYLIKSKIQEKLKNNLENLYKYLKKNNAKSIFVLGEEPVETKMEEFEIFGIVQDTDFSQEEFNVAKEESLAMLYSYLKDVLKLDDEIIGDAYTYYIKYDNKEKRKTMIFGYPVSQKVESIEGAKYYPVKGGDAITLKYNPRTSTIEKNIEKIKTYAKEKEISISGQFIEKELESGEMQIFYLLND